MLNTKYNPLIEASPQPNELGTKPVKVLAN